MFRFTLQAVLDHRLTQEERRQRDWAEALQRVEAARLQRAAIEADIELRFAEIRRGQRDGLALAMRELIERWIAEQQRNALQAEAEIRKLEDEADRRRLALVEAARARLALESLRDQELRDARLRETRAENKAFDEIAIREFLIQSRQEKDAGREERIAS
jgi:flagellar export protein FliJ